MIARKEQGTVSGDIASVKTRARLRIRSNKSAESLYAETVKGIALASLPLLTYIL